jgi:hypothetical protein
MLSETLDLELEDLWNGRCRNRDIEVYILYEGERLPICIRCWTKIADSSIQWSEQKGRCGG